MAFIRSCMGAKLVGNGAVAPTRVCSKRTVASMGNVTRREALTFLATIPLLIQAPLPAFAERTATGAKRSFDRYHPRILALIESTRQIRSLVPKGDATAANDIINGKLYDVKGRRALSIYATSFSDNYLGQRSKDMLGSVNRFYKEMGFVAAGTDMVEHYGKAVAMLREYYEGARLPKQELAGLEL